ncbi:uncharacterized protein DC041_0001387 [Schistosoma bovis]|uniref:Uncharacterized protein n=1 Tax=Schistosoma bovis TaxID=6184 RepID=A0A430PY25_SCHBO|nr:uncharacterized protein DC041_0004693 [Schistosoma bovis]RTG88827.1 uncharacterized protein DC041_0001387 [Schistosoma bovis]
MSSVSQGKNEKMLASHESALTPTLKWRKNQFTCNNSNTTTTATNILTPRNDVSYATFLSYPHQSDLMTQSTTSPQYMLPNDCIIKSINDNSNDLKEINSIPLSNIKMVLTERKKSSYPDLFMLKTNQNVTTNHAIVKKSELCTNEFPLELFVIAAVKENVSINNHYYSDRDNSITLYYITSVHNEKILKQNVLNKRD